MAISASLIQPGHWRPSFGAISSATASPPHLSWRRSIVTGLCGAYTNDTPTMPGTRTWDIRLRSTMRLWRSTAPRPITGDPAWSRESVRARGAAPERLTRHVAHGVDAMWADVERDVGLFVVAPPLLEHLFDPTKHRAALGRLALGILE